MTWQLLLETQHWYHWIKSRNFNYKAIYLYLPKRFCVGQRLSRCPPGGQSSFIVDCELDKYTHRYKLSIQDCRHDDQPAYYTFQLTPYERYSTKLIATADYYRSYRLNAVGIFLRSALKVEDKKSFKEDKSAIENSLRDSIKEFEALCWDRTQFGPRESHYSGSWIDWYRSPGRVHYYKNRSGHNGPELGELINSGERIGFVYPSGATGSLDEWKERFYIESVLGGYVRAILKHHGEQLMYRDRLILTTRECDVDLSVVTLSLEDCVSAEDFLISPIRLFGRRGLVRYEARVGQHVKQGDPLAVYQENSGSPTITLRSPYCGKVVDHGVDIGWDSFCPDGNKPLVRLKCKPASVTN
ncbi:hypothetical protein [Nitrococcus mobilis]|uniref:hypothetical protein n=1 Tax=Nitrococcus mobilis TaxID=35797 RepID=UPI0012E9F181|nr:hypothetical protein [Nitrococcus mobilis]